MNNYINILVNSGVLYNQEDFKLNVSKRTLEIVCNLITRLNDLTTDELALYRYVLGLYHYTYNDYLDTCFEEDLDFYYSKNEIKKMFN